jgi:hypothetical protein
MTYDEAAAARRDGALPLLWLGLGGLSPIAAATALVPLRDHMRNANVGLVLVAVVVLVAVGGGRQAGGLAAIVSALSFDFFFTKPYLRLRVASGDDIATTLLLLAVGLVVGSVSARERRARSSAEARRGEVKRIDRLAELVARGDDPSDVIMAAQAELTSLLHLRDCRFEAPPFPTSLERLERSGVVSWPQYRFRDGGFELPADGVELPVLGRGNVLGRFVLEPQAKTGVSLEQRVVAVALADQVGSVLATPQQGREHQHG